MNRQKSSGIALIWVLSGIVIVGIVALFIYEIVNRPPNRHIGDNKPWNEKMSQGSADAKNVFIDYTDYFCSFCAEVEAATSTELFKNDYIKSGKVRYEHRVVTLLKEMTNNTELVLTLRFVPLIKINIGSTPTISSRALKAITLIKESA